MLVRVRASEGLLHLRVRSDHRGPAWARLEGYALDHLERAEDWAPRLREAARRLHPHPEGVLAALREAFGPCPLEVLSSLPSGVAPPRWPLRLRTGGPGAPWPFDPETAALELGLRRALKREAFDEREAAADVDWLRGRGLAVRRVGEVDRDGRRVLLAARSLAELERLEPLERAARRGRHEAVAELGAWLGYPPCCVEAFARLGPRDDALSFALRLDHPRETARPAELSFLVSALALVSHLPCEPGCSRTLVQARAVLAALEVARPGFVAGWRSLAARLQVIDAEGRALALHAIDVDGGVEVRDAVELSAEAEPLARPRPELVGARLAWRGRALVGEGLDGALVADHRAERGGSPRRA